MKNKIKIKTKNKIKTKTKIKIKTKTKLKIKTKTKIKIKTKITINKMEMMKEKMVKMMIKMMIKMILKKEFVTSMSVDVPPISKMTGVNTNLLNSDPNGAKEILITAVCVLVPGVKETI